MEHRILNRINAAIVFAVSLVVYALTVAPTTSYWDCGEFITSAYILGVPHPPGSPLYVLIGRLFTMMPFPEDIGLRVNLISVLVSALTIMFTYLVIVRLLRYWRGLPKTLDEKIALYAGGILGALAFAFSDSFWFNAVEAEVYAFSVFFTALVVWLILLWVEKADADQPASDRILLLIAYLIGLAAGIHLLNILALPTVFLIIYFKKFEVSGRTFGYFILAGLAGFITIYRGIIMGIPVVIEQFSFTVLALLIVGLFVAIYYAIQNHKRILSMILMAIMLVTIGYSTYTALYIRSNLQPAINENNPNVPSRFVSYLKREQYGDIPITERRAPLWEYQIKKMYVRYFGWQFIGKGDTLGPDRYILETLSTRGLYALPFLVGLLGFLFHFFSDWKRAFSILALFIFTGVAISIYLNQEDPQPRERDYAYVGSFFAFALWIGMGGTALIDLVAGSIRQSQLLKKLGIGLTLVLLLTVPYTMFAFNYKPHDRTGNFVASDYSYNILESCEPNAILFTNGDNDTFPLWFLQYVYGIRTDVRVVNLSLLNTPWYIKQLRDEEPKVPITLNDNTVEALAPRLWQARRMTVSIPRQRALDELAKGEDNSRLTPEDIPANHKLEYELQGTLSTQYGPAIRVQDMMIQHIMQANKFEKPIYFAVTVSPQNMLGLNNREHSDLPNYLRMDGLAFQIMPYGGPDEFISPTKLETNLFEKFRYRNLNNPDVFYGDNIKGLLQNYRSAFLRLASFYERKGAQDPAMNESALRVLDKMEEVMPETVLPFRDFRFSVSFGLIYADAGRPDQLEEHVERATKIYDMTIEDKIYLMQFYSRYLKNDAKADSMAQVVLTEQGASRDIYRFVAGYYAQKQDYAKAQEVLENWLVKNPGDSQMEQQLATFKTLTLIDDSLTTANGADGTMPDSTRSSQ